jgi:hypothetical protein
MDRQYDFILNELNRYLGCSCSLSKNPILAFMLKTVGVTN